MSFITRNNIQHHCRTCLAYMAATGENESVPKYHLKTTENLAGWFENFTSLRVFGSSDEYPQFICGECFKMLKGFQEFQLLTWQANDKLSALLKKQQTEPSESKNVISPNPSKDTTLELQSEIYDEMEMDLEEEFISLKVNSVKQPIGILDSVKMDTNLNIFTSKLQSGTNSDVNIRIESEIPSINPDSNDLKDSNSCSAKNIKRQKINQCGFCRKIFKCENRLEAHVLSLHNKLRPFACQYCHLRFTRKPHLISHERVHTGEKPYPCDICGSRFRRMDTMKLHRKGHISKITKECRSVKVLPKKAQNKTLRNKTQNKNLEPISTADFQFEISSELNIKVELVEESPDAEFLNKKINDQSVSDNEEEMRALIIDNVTSGASQIKEILNAVCDTTNVKTINSKNVTQEKDHDKNNTCGENIMKKHQCNMCQKYFSSTRTLNNHISSTHKGLRPYACQFCDSRFGLKLTLRRHEIMHTGEKPFACDICGRQFAYSWNMRKHQKTHKRKNSKEVDFLKSGPPTSQNKLLENMNTYETKSKENIGKSNLNINSMNEIHCCHVCQKVFSYKCRLQAHILTVHKGIRRFVCEVCHLNFISKYYLREHERIHTGEKPFTCDICDRRFRTHQVLKNHRKTHGKKTKTKGDNMKSKVVLLLSNNK